MSMEPSVRDGDHHLGDQNTDWSLGLSLFGDFDPNLSFLDDTALLPDFSQDWVDYHEGHAHHQKYQPSNLENSLTSHEVSSDDEQTPKNPLPAPRKRGRPRKVPNLTPSMPENGSSCSSQSNRSNERNSKEESQYIYDDEVLACRKHMFRDANFNVDDTTAAAEERHSSSGSSGSSSSSSSASSSSSFTFSPPSSPPLPPPSASALCGGIVTRRAKAVLHGGSEDDTAIYFGGGGCAPGTAGRGGASSSTYTYRRGGSGNQGKPSVTGRKKAPEEARSVLMDWINDNKEHPYPTRAQKVQLAHSTGLTVPQIVHWMSNVRKRRLIPLMRGKREPASKIDHKFLEEIAMRNTK